MSALRWERNFLSVYGIRVFENKVLRRIFRPKGDAIGEWRRFHNEEPRSFTVHLI